MSDRPGRHARRRPADLADVARARLERTRPATGWVPRRPADAATSWPDRPPGPEGELPDRSVPEAAVPEYAAPAAGAAPPAAAVPAAAAVARRRLRRAALAERVPVGLRAAVLTPAPRAVAGLALVAGLGVLLGLGFVWFSRPVTESAPPVRRSTPTPVAPASAAARLVVHVVGAVRRPGLVELPSGARVSDAVAAAGGPTKDADLSSVNLARRVADGEQLVVLAKGQAPPPGAAQAGAGGGGAPGVLDLNAATVEQLQDLPGVGPVLAQRIVDWRTEHGRFSSVDELREVSGIGDRKFAELRSKVRV